MKPQRCVIIWNAALLAWFLLDMTGLVLGGATLVSRAWREDGVFMLVYLGCLLCFFLANRVGKYLLGGWLVAWFAAQFLSHWRYTLFGGGEGKARYFADTIKLFERNGVYIPDLYHIVLHLLILGALGCAAAYIVKTSGKKNAA